MTNLGSNPRKLSSQIYTPYNINCLLSNGSQFAHVEVLNRDGKSLE